ncbi:hypothetical protein [Streptomyces cylindrosporus]|uniref:Uncharacterized protein n=1 Tax=Streptomyces cylindrosporus TaxID=2927583 RepID=A0ABS9YK39_9ACTN|nr:hypothetical protein [Streptomyces cylindrosporus]MCI3277617.1 hypothetical protein [Streptomyces cylindrosporus]
MPNQPTTREQDFRFARYATVTVAVAIAAVISIVLGCMFGFKAYGRYQARQDVQNYVKTSQVRANNQVKLNEIEIGQQQQRVKIEQQKAEIRKQNAIGIREAQDIINKTLTPLYVQHEMVDQLGEIAKSGKNSSVIYIPVGPDGLPVVATAGAKR